MGLSRTWLEKKVKVIKPTGGNNDILYYENCNYRISSKENISRKRKRKIKRIINDLRFKMWKELEEHYPGIAGHKNRYFDLSESKVYISDYFLNNRYPLKKYNIHDYHANFVI